MSPHAYLIAILCTLSSLAGERAIELKAALNGADKLEIKQNEFYTDAPGVIFTFEKPAEISKLINSLDFQEESPGYCACSGDCQITFYRAGKKLTSLGHHHGFSLRWNGKTWKGDSVFTAASAKAWRTWFQQHGEPMFQNAHTAEIARKKQEAAVREAFLKPFPRASRKIIEGFDEALRKHHQANPHEQFASYDDHPVMLAASAELASSISDRQEFARTTSKAIGARGQWMPQPAEVELVLRGIENLEAKDYQTALSSSDPETLNGIAYLFFAGRLSQKIQKKQTGPLAAKLIEFVAGNDETELSDYIYHKLGNFSGPEFIDTLERIALGELTLTKAPHSFAQNLSFPHATCLHLAAKNSPRFQECLKRVSALEPQFPDDKIALLLARSIRGEKNLLPDTIFESRSTQICLKALSLLEQEHTTKSLDLIINKATTHSWAAIREASVLTIERMTGKKWYQNQQHERAEWHGKTIREWWSKNRSTFKLPKKQPE